jgi:hypothetical protein
MIPAHSSQRSAASDKDNLALLVSGSCAHLDRIVLCRERFPSTTLERSFPADGGHHRLRKKRSRVTRAPDDVSRHLTVMLPDATPVGLTSRVAVYDLGSIGSPKAPSPSR